MQVDDANDDTNTWLLPAHVENITPLTDHDLNQPPVLATMLGRHTVKLTPIPAAQQAVPQPDSATPPLPKIEEQHPLWLQVLPPTREHEAMALKEYAKWLRSTPPSAFERVHQEGARLQIRLAHRNNDALFELMLDLPRSMEDNWVGDRA